MYYFTGKENIISENFQTLGKSDGYFAKDQRISNLKDVALSYELSYSLFQ